MTYRFTIDGRPITKKNSMQKTRRGLIQSKQYREYEEAALWQLLDQKPEGLAPIGRAVKMEAFYYMPDRKGWPDLFGLLQATADILEKAGIIEDDGYIADVAYSCIAGVDPEWPRAEIKVIPMPDDKLNELHPKLRKRTWDRKQLNLSRSRQ